MATQKWNKSMLLCVRLGSIDFCLFCATTTIIHKNMMGEGRCSTPDTVCQSMKNVPILTTCCGVFACSPAIRGIASNMAAMSVRYHLSRSARRSELRNIPSALWAKSWGNINKFYLTLSFKLKEGPNTDLKVINEGQNATLAAPVSASLVDGLLVCRHEAVEAALDLHEERSEGDAEERARVLGRHDVLSQTHQHVHAAAEQQNNSYRTTPI